MIKKDQDSKPVVNKTYVPFYEMLLQRRDEARRSLLMETEGLQDAGSIKQFCSKMGQIKHCFLYRRPGKVGRSKLIHITSTPPLSVIVMQCFKT